MTIWDGRFYKIADGRVIGPVKTGRDPANGKMWAYCPKLRDHFESYEIVEEWKPYGASK